MIHDLKALAELNGDKLEVVSMDRLKSLQEEITQFQKETELNSFQEWIINNCYKFEDIPEIARSVIIVAVSHAAYANITFTKNGKKYKMYGHVDSRLDKAIEYTMNAVRNAGYAIDVEMRLPLKRLAVQSSLAKYGRNNITYVKGMGSYFAYVAFVTDMPCEEDSWRGVTASSECENCDVCIRNCPTGAIRKDSFLIDNQRCLSALNEDERDFPVWLTQSAHHTPYDCLKCQVKCPMNAGNWEIPDVFFDEAETERILGGAPYEDTSSELKKKSLCWVLNTGNQSLAICAFYLT